MTLAAGLWRRDSRRRRPRSKDLRISIEISAQGKEIQQAILDGAQDRGSWSFVSTLCICIVFVPMFFLTGVARYLFVPLAESVVFAMLASYLLSRTLVPTMAKYLLRGHAGAGHIWVEAVPSGSPPIRFEEAFEHLRGATSGCWRGCLNLRAFLVGVLAFSIVSLALLIPFLGQDFFPSVDRPVQAASPVRYRDSH